MKNIEKLGYSEVKIDNPDRFMVAKFVRNRTKTIVDSVIVFMKPNDTLCIKKSRFIYKHKEDKRLTSTKATVHFNSDELVWFGIILKNIHRQIHKHKIEV